jgi:hypothetical protein
LCELFILQSDKLKLAYISGSYDSHHHLIIVTIKIREPSSRMLDRKPDDWLMSKAEPSDILVICAGSIHKEIERAEACTADMPEDRVSSGVPLSSQRWKLERKIMIGRQKN